MAFDGQNYLLVWSDARSDGAGTPRAIYAARVSPTGEVLDPSAFPVATGPNTESHPRAIFNGESTVVTWWDIPPAEILDTAFPSLWAARVSPGGVVLDAPALKITESAYYVDTALGVDGSVRFVLQHGENSGMVRLSQNGAISSSMPLPWLSDYSGHAHALAFDGTNHLMVSASWYQGPGDPNLSIVGARIGPDDALLDPSPLSIATTDGSTIGDVAVGFGGGVYLVVWIESIEDDSSSVRLRAVRLTPDGTTLDPQDGVLLAEYATSASYPAVVFDGQVFVIAWLAHQDNSEGWPRYLHGATVTPEGQVGPVFVISDAPYFDLPALASPGDGQTLIAFGRLLEEAPYATRRVRTVRLTTCDPSICLGGNCDACGDDPGDPPAPDDPTDLDIRDDTKTASSASSSPSCGCRAVGAPTPAAGPLLALLVGLLAAGRLRRRRTVSR